MRKNRRDVLRSIGAGTALLVGSGVAAADDHDEDGPSGKGFPFEDDDDEGAEVRVIHASPDAPAVDVFVDGSSVLEGVTFKTVSDYLELPGATYDVAVAPAGAGVDNAVIDTSVTVENGTDYTIAATNTLANIEPVVFVDDNESESVAKPRLRVVHLSPDAPAVDVAQTDGPGVVFEPEVALEDLTFTNASGYLELLPTDYEFAVRPADSETVVKEIEADLDPGATYTAFAVGLLDPASETEAFDVVLSEDVPPITERAGRGRGIGIGH